MKTKVEKGNDLLKEIRTTVEKWADTIKKDKLKIGFLITAAAESKNEGYHQTLIFTSGSQNQLVEAVNDFEKDEKIKELRQVIKVMNTLSELCSDWDDK